MNLYLTGPTAGYFDDNRAAFEAAALTLRARKLAVTSRADLDDAVAGELRQELLVALSHDALVLLPGWRSSESASFIVGVACRVGMKAFELPTLAPVNP